MVLGVLHVHLRCSGKAVFGNGAYHTGTRGTAQGSRSTTFSTRGTTQGTRGTTPRRWTPEPGNALSTPWHTPPLIWPNSLVPEHFMLVLLVTPKSPFDTPNPERPFDSFSLLNLSVSPLRHSSYPHPAAHALRTALHCTAHGFHTSEWPKRTPGTKFWSLICPWCGLVCGLVWTAGRPLRPPKKNCLIQGSPPGSQQKWNWNYS